MIIGASFFDADERAERRAAAEENAVHIARADQAEAEQKAARVAECGRRVNESLLLKLYDAAGIDPVYADPDRRTLVSLPLMLSMGWRIEAVGDRNVLTRPYGMQHGGAA